MQTFVVKSVGFLTRAPHIIAMPMLFHHIAYIVKSNAGNKTSNPRSQTLGREGALVRRPKSYFLLKSCLFAFLSLRAALLPGQELGTADITVHFKGLKSPVATLGYFYGGSLYRLDSVAVDTLRETVSFRRQTLKPGMYFIAVDGGRLFDFFVSKPGTPLVFRGSVEHPDSLRAPGDPENTAFFEYESARRAQEAHIRQQGAMFDMLRQAVKDDPTVLKNAEESMAKLFRKMDTLARRQAARYPDYLHSKVLKAIMPPPPPANIQQGAAQRANPVYLRWVREHYWDHCDFSDETLLYNNLWPLYFEEYFNRLVARNPDSLTAAIDGALARFPKDGPFYQYAVKRFTQNFELSDRPGADRIFVHMVDHYQKAKETPWIDEATLLRLAYKADVHRPNLTGNPAPELILSDETGAKVDLKNVAGPYTLLVFYSPLCQHCMELLPGIYQTWQAFESKGLKGVAVCADKQYAHWKNFVAEQQFKWIDLADPEGKNTFETPFSAFNLPVVYLLDKDKKILWKRIKAAELKAVLEQYLGK
jgi:peroxiredoxin